MFMSVFLVTTLADSELFRSTRIDKWKGQITMNEWMNEWMTVFQYWHMLTYKEGAALKHNAYNEIYSSNYDHAVGPRNASFF